MNIYKKAATELRQIRREFRDFRIENHVASEDDLREQFAENIKADMMRLLWSGDPADKDFYSKVCNGLIVRP